MLAGAVCNIRYLGYIRYNSLDGSVMEYDFRDIDRQPKIERFRRRVEQPFIMRIYDY